MKEILLIIQVFVFITQTLIFVFSSDGELSFLIVNFSALTVFISFIISWLFRNKTKLKGYGFSIIAFFVLMNAIIAFQIPLELVYGNIQLLDPQLNLVYDLNILNKLVAFSSLMLNSFLLGVTYSYTRISKLVNSKSTNNLYIPTKPLLFTMIILLVIYIATVDPAYLKHGHGTVGMGSIAESSIGIALRVSALYIAVMIFNFRNRSSSFVKYILYINPIYLTLLSLVILIFLMASNRSYIIMLASPLLFSLFIATRKKVSLIKVILVFLGLSSFATFFKIYGIQVFSQSSLELNDGLFVSKFFFPMTAELSASIYSSNILYSLYDKGLSLNGISFLVGLLRTFPGFVSFLDVEPILYNSGVLATVISNSEYGVGTTSIADLLINFNMIVSLLIFLVLGYFFTSSEIKAYSNSFNIYSYVIYLSICILILFYPRGSLNDLLPTILFNLIFFKLYYAIFVKNKEMV